MISISTILTFSAERAELCVDIFSLENLISILNMETFDPSIKFISLIVMIFNCNKIVSQLFMILQYKLQSCKESR